MPSCVFLSAALSVVISFEPLAAPLLTCVHLLATALCISEGGFCQWQMLCWQVASCNPKTLKLKACN